ncbi:hypothetical protein PTQ21_28855 [Paenibacillus marchantiae]|uniref:hypothetical protein n=1 Tax=Paenibacillus marchantiae TaxID=3026433 RepID=UPI00237BCC2E|nr:hypothetical protein [Paenibacillus marchantiae]WDQ32342.1 hypothetical protein PTQ21_28855 [Paenibacillus marchantiae]
MNIIQTAGFRYREFAVILRCLYDYLPFGTGLNRIFHTAGRGGTRLRLGKELDPGSFRFHPYLGKIEEYI